MIALESAAQRRLDSAIRAIGANDAQRAASIQGVSRELGVIGTARLAKSVGAAALGTSESEWTKLEGLYQTRNTIVHRQQRRLPDLSLVREQLMAVYRYVRDTVVDAPADNQPESG